MINSSYPNDALVKLSNGTTQGEVILFQFLGPVSVLLRNIAVPWIFLGNRFATNNGFWFKFALDFTFLVLPIALCLTLLSSLITFVLTLEIIAVLSLVVFLLCEYMLIAREKPSFKSIVNEVIDENHSPTIFITYLRSTVLLTTGIAILAVDFRVFPRRFAKTENYGRSIMDLGVASFIFCSAVVNTCKGYPALISHTRSTPRRFRSSTFILCCIGLLRIAFLYLFDYPHEVSEYGVHWNFFFTLAFIQVARNMLGKRFHLIYGIVFALIHQTLLTEYKLQDWLLSESTSRSDFVSANREGLFSLLGYLSFYYISSAIANYIFSAGIRLKSWFYRNLQLYLLTAFLYLSQQYFETSYGSPSRRIVNIPYIFEMLVFHTLLLSGFLLVQLASLFGWAAQMPQFSTDENPFERSKPCLMDSINGNALIFFLLANILTGLVNLISTAAEIHNDMQSTAVIILYIFITTGIIHAYSRRRLHQ